MSGAAGGGRSDLTVGTVPSLVRRLAIPASTGFLFNTLYNLVDTWVAGRWSATALAGLSASFPVFFIIIAASVGAGQGATVLIGNALGRGEPAAARRLVPQALLLALLVGALISAVGLALARPMYAVIGLQGEALGFGLDYIRPTLAGAVLFVLNAILNAVLTAQGDTVSNRNALIVGSFANAGLAPWLMWGGFGMPRLGMLGIALATLTIQAATASYLAWRCRGSPLLAATRVRALDWRPHGRLLVELLRQGLPAGLNLVLIGAGIFIITSFAGRHGEAVVAAYGAAIRIEQLVLLPTIGLNVATLALVAQNAGAGRFDRVVTVYRTGVGYGVGLMASGGVLLWLAAPWLAAQFARTAEVAAHVTTYLRIEVFTLCAYALIMQSVALMQGLKRPLFGLAVHGTRHFLAPVPVFWLLDVGLGLGPRGIWFGILLITWSSALVATGFALHYLRRTLRTATALAPPACVPDDA